MHAVKPKKFKVYLEEKHIKAINVLYMGDDIPDLEVIQLAGLPVALQMLPKK